MTLQMNELVEKACLNDTKSLSELTELVEPHIKSYVRYLVADRDAACDLTQETMLKMLKSLGNLQKTESFWPWLYRIAGNRVKDHWRQQGKRRNVRFSSLARHSLESIMIDESTCPETSVIGKETCSIVTGALATLESRNRKIVSMRCTDGMSYSEIGRNIGCSETNARVSFHRAKRSIQPFLQKCLA